MGVCYHIIPYNGWGVALSVTVSVPSSYTVCTSFVFYILLSATKIVECSEMLNIISGFTKCCIGLSRKQNNGCSVWNVKRKCLCFSWQEDMKSYISSTLFLINNFHVMPALREIKCTWAWIQGNVAVFRIREKKWIANTLWPLGNNPLFYTLSCLKLTCMSQLKHLQPLIEAKFALL